ncbi:MAG: hypothetical protein JW712_08925, partial [Dehalococcoidales bacterium]|nr:hypothetical protein [Dehalococcoidales bacterium]
MKMKIVMLFCIAVLLSALFSSILAVPETVHAEDAPDIEWERTFGGESEDGGISLQQATDGGFIIIGTTFSYGAGESDVWLIKTDSNGNKQWDKTFGGIEYDFAGSIQQTTDGGFIIVGTTFSYGAGESDVWLIKTDS